MTNYQLMYFDGRGRAELARWLFAAAGQEYVDTRLKKEEWPQIKPTTPFGQLPVLIVDDNFKLAQSLAIGRFLAKRFGFMGKDEYEEAQCNMVTECTEDMLQALIKTLFGDDASKAAAKEKWQGSQQAEFLDKFEKLLQANNNGDGFFVGDKITMADMCFCITTDYIASAVDWGKYPKLAALRDRVEKDNKQIAEWIAKRPVTQF